MVNTRSVRAGNSSQPLGQGKVPSNLPPHLPLPILNMFPHVDHVEGGDENQPHNSAHNSASTANQDVVAAQLAAMQQYFGVFQLVLAQLLARNNLGDPFINLLNPAQQPPAPQQNPKPVQHAPALSESQDQSHIAPAQQPFPDDVTRRLDSLEKLVVEQRGAPPPHHAADSIPHPLNTNITLEPYPVGFRTPQLETYDGTKDPDDHLHAFYSCMKAQNASNALMCKIFSSTLRGNARTWYYSLPPRSISSYTEMASAFAIKFSSRRLIRKTTSELMRVKQKQRDGESLKNYMSRFNDAVLEVSSFDQAVGIAAVISGLNHERFRDSLIKHVATTFSEVNDRSLKFITTEEYALSQKPTPSKNQNPDWRDENPSKKQMRIAQNREQCNSLRSELESLAQKEMLNEYIQKAEQSRFVREQRPQPQGVRNPPNRQGVGYQQAPPSLPPPARIIHTITGGLEVVVTPHNDPLVTSVMINNCEVQHVLVDTGSAPDIMYFHCFESLGLDLALLQRYDGPIYGFNNQPVPVEGVLTMNVAFESGRNYVTPSVRFLVVKMASSFNVVIGQPTLIEIRAVVSQSHLCMKFLTPMGIATLRGNQEVARHCYITSVTRPQKDKDQTPEANPQQILNNQQVMGVEIVDNRLEDETRAIPVENVEEAIKEKVEKLLQAGFVRKVDYCEWVANLVLVKKANVPMALEDEEKTSFYAGDEIYCYVMMPFGLKNVGTTYQKMVTIVFRAQIGRNLEVYVGDIVVKSLKVEDHLTDLDETFNNLRKNRMRLNPAKCIFGVESGKFLGFMVSQRGIEVNPEKIRAIAEMEPPKSVKDIQRLTGRVAALHRFISKSTDKCLPFFKIMRSTTQKDESGKQKKFEWSQECQVAFEELKSYFSSPPLLTKAIDGEILYLYLGISDKAISSVLVREEAKQQKSIYYISSVLHGALAVVTSARKLRPYFQSHPIIVLTDQPLQQILQKPECSGRLIKWVVELGEFEITFQQRSAIRTQALADLIVECTPYGYRSEHALKFNFDATNNMAEYEALLLGLQLALELKISTIQVYSDSQLVVNQINSIYEVVDPVMVKYIALVAELKCKFQNFCLSKIPRIENEQVDSLSKFASDSSLSSRSVFVEVLDEPSFMKPQIMEISMNLDTLSWTNSIISFLQDETVLEDKSFSLPLLWCLNPYEVEYALREIHEGVCGSHVGARTLAHKVLRQGYYWPNMYKDATHFVHKRPKCQFFAHLTHQPTEELTNLIAPWPFAQWGLDLLGPFVKGVGGVTHLIVGVDYFKKWVEARPLSSLTSKKVEDFVFSSIICRYGIPNQIVADNGTQFNCSSFQDFCSSYGIKLQFTSIYHPKSNGMVEYVNKCILEGIKPRLEQHKAKWAEELNNVLWAYRTTSKTATGETPYHLAFGTEAVIPIEIGVPSFRVTHFDEGQNGQLLRENLDLLAEAGLTGFETRFGKLAPNWEGPYTVAKVPHPGAYVLKDVEGKRVPKVWNVNNLKKFYP
ncbi:hypothetical protein SLEP1_g18313 [Rubroshorea leprosula]|uniref:Uncharacterized protein n=1 Tax=Rubroshorea leprosula TaxID=152421 RepID=A0AAV5J0M3_9ROSI|nr:hypothetical protein SLEP1_g18313 [Rubroshorea leprosula]